MWTAEKQKEKEKEMRPDLMQGCCGSSLGF